MKLNKIKDFPGETVLAILMEEVVHKPLYRIFVALPPKCDYQRLDEICTSFAVSLPSVCYLTPFP
jgi:hypothetical protein